MLAMETTTELAKIRILCHTGKARRIREEANVSLSEIATEVGVTPTTVWRWETNLRRPAGAMAHRYAAVLRGLQQVLTSNAG